MSKKLLMLDKDGTLVTPRSGQFVNKPWDQVPLPGAREAVKSHHSNDWEIVIISNQGGVEKGYKSIESCLLEMEYCLELFPEIKECFFCPDFDGDHCRQVWRGDSILHTPRVFPTMELGLQGLFRKPNPGMLLLAHYLYGPVEDLLYVGDRAEDEAAAKAAGIPFMWAEEWRSPFV